MSVSQENPKSATPPIGNNGRLRPPEEPPDGAKSWRDMVLGDGPVRNPGLTPGLLDGKVSVSFPYGAEGDPVIEIGQEVMDVLALAWKSSVIVRLLDGFVPYDTMERKLKELWRPRGRMFFADLPNGYYVVRFDNEYDYCNALTGGPWMIFGHYLITKAWCPEFDPEKDVITTSPAWVRISKLPIVFYEEEVLWKIASRIGDQKYNTTLIQKIPRKQK